MFAFRKIVNEKREKFRFCSLKFIATKSNLFDHLFFKRTSNREPPEAKFAEHCSAVELPVEFREVLPASHYKTVYRLHPE